MSEEGAGLNSPVHTLRHHSESLQCDTRSLQEKADTQALAQLWAVFTASSPVRHYVRCVFCSISYWSNPQECQERGSSTEVYICRRLGPPHVDDTHIGPKIIKVSISLFLLQNSRLTMLQQTFLKSIWLAVTVKSLNLTDLIKRSMTQDLSAVAE